LPDLIDRPAPGKLIDRGQKREVMMHKPAALCLTGQLIAVLQEKFLFRPRQVLSCVCHTHNPLVAGINPAEQRFFGNIDVIVKDHVPAGNKRNEQKAYLDKNKRGKRREQIRRYREPSFFIEARHYFPLFPPDDSAEQ